MEKFKVACATDDGSTFVGRHFGEAFHYDVYEVSPDHIRFLKRVDNTTEEDEEIHADPKKAKGISGILKAEQIHVVTTKIFGPNIMRIKSNFVCVLSGSDEIEVGLLKIQQNLSRIHEEWEKGPDRSFLDFRKVDVIQ